MSISTSSNTGTYRKAINNIQSNYLLKTGGTMSGSIATSAAVPIMSSTDSSSIEFHGGGNSYTTGAYLYLTGQNHSNAGSFTLAASGNSNVYRLTGKTDGTLTWNGNNVLTSYGTMNGSLTCSQSVIAKKSTDDSLLVIYTGTDASKGATFGGYGINHETQPGNFYAKATDGTNSYYFYCKSDGTLTWRGNEIRFVKSTYSSGTTWYRVWSDGWIEQGGRKAVSGDGVWTVTLPKAMKDTNYNLTQWTGFQSSYKTQYDNGLQITALTTTSFTYSSWAYVNTLFWRIEGYMA